MHDFPSTRFKHEYQCLAEHPHPTRRQHSLLFSNCPADLFMIKRIQSDSVNLGRRRLGPVSLGHANQLRPTEVPLMLISTDRHEVLRVGPKTITDLDITYFTGRQEPSNNRLNLRGRLHDKSSMPKTDFTCPRDHPLHNRQYVRPDLACISAVMCTRLGWLGAYLLVGEVHT